MARKYRVIIDVVVKNTSQNLEEINRIISVIRNNFKHHEVDIERIRWNQEPRKWELELIILEGFDYSRLEKALEEKDILIGDIELCKENEDIDEARHL